MLGTAVRAGDGRLLGRLVDFSLEIGDRQPRVERLAVGRGRQVRLWVDAAAASFRPDGIRLPPAAADPTPAVAVSDRPERQLLVRRDVLDTQIIDVAGKRWARVAEVVLAVSPVGLQVVAVEVGAAGVLRRLGLQRLAATIADQRVDWADLHLTSDRGHALQLGSPTAAVHRLAPPELASAVSHLPTAQAVQVLEAVAPDTAAGALSASHHRMGARLLHAVSRATASSVVARLPADDATAILRHLTPEAAEQLLESVHSERAATLRRLLAHPADTAGGLMNSEVLTASRGEPVEAIRQRVAAQIPELEGMATVIVIDDQRRPVGSFEPNDLLAGRPTPRMVPTVAATLPVERVIDLFALGDHLALPVVDPDGALVGVITVDDVLEELLVERLPGQGRYARIRHRARAGAQAGARAGVQALRRGPLRPRPGTGPRPGEGRP